MPSPPGARRHCKAQAPSRSGERKRSKEASISRSELPTRPLGRASPFGGKAFWRRAQGRAPTCAVRRAFLRSSRDQRADACREGRMPSLRGPSPGEVRQPSRNCAVGNERASSIVPAGSEGLRAATASDGPLGGEGILPSHAPQGALVRKRFKACAPVGASEGKMPSPPGARRHCKAHAPSRSGERKRSKEASSSRSELPTRPLGRARSLRRRN